MSDREFDNYLALLSRLLKLGQKQRDAIAGELRSHLEDRLDELLRNSNKTLTVGSSRSAGNQ